MLTIVVRLQTYLLDRKAPAHEDGATAVEYGLMLGLLVIVLMVGAVAFSNKVNKNYNDITDTVGKALSSAG